jgi:hypothetical protein
MPRIRTLKPEHRQHRKVGPLSHVAYRLWVGMILEADDHGRLVCDAEQLRVLIFGYHPKTTTALVERALGELVTPGLIRLYVSEGRRYADFPSWADHQRIDRKQPSRLPMYEHSSNGHRTSDEGSLLIGKDLEGNGSEVEGNTHAACATAAEAFDEFWVTWPSSRRVGKADALKTWCALNPDPMLRQVILAAVTASKQRPDWQREGGRYIPYPHRWLGKRRWEDAPPAAQATLLTEKTQGNQAAAAAFLRRMGATDDDTG